MDGNIMFFMTLSTKVTLAQNIKALMESKDWKEPELSRQSGVSQKTINNLLNTNYIGSPRLDIAEKLANTFGLELWHLLVPNLSTDLLQNKTIEKLIECYSNANPEGRENTLRIAESEMRYNAINKQTNDNGKL